MDEINDLPRDVAIQRENIERFSFALQAGSNDQPSELSVSSGLCLRLPGDTAGRLGTGLPDPDEIEVEVTITARKRESE